MKTTPHRIAALAHDLGLSEVTSTDLGWSAVAELKGCWPLPRADESFGKQSSCVTGRSILPSCAEVEFTLRARDQGWTGGWVNTYGDDRRIPEPWRSAIISREDCAALVGVEFPAVRVPNSGFPDLLLEREGAIVGAECKRSRGRYFDSNCRRKTFKGDARKETQDAWTVSAHVAGIPTDALLTIWWTRLESAPCDERDKRVRRAAVGQPSRVMNRRL